jgi:transcriptional regulator with XRE-family HTH domain
MVAYLVGGDTPNVLGEAIRRLRGKRSQAGLARAAGLTPSCWSEYERGKRIPRRKQMDRVLEALGCSSETFERELRSVAERRDDSGGEGPFRAAEDLVKDIDRELREVEHEIDRMENRRKLFLLLRSRLEALPSSTLVAVRVERTAPTRTAPSPGGG